MQIVLYTTKSANNVIGKTLESAVELDCNFKGIADYINPVLQLYSASVITSNYCYLPNLNRYYFISNVQILPNNYYILSLHVDVLESWKADILASNVKLKRQKESNKYYNNEYESQVNKSVMIYNSNVTFTDVSTNVLTTIGGI